MPLDGIFIHNLVNELKVIENSRIQKINQIGKSEFVFTLHKNKNYKLFISLDSSYYRIHLTENNYDNPLEASNLTMLLRKHFEGGIIEHIEQHSLDRIITISINKLNEFYDRKTKKIILELMGKNSNLIITDSNDIIIDAFKKIGVSENGQTILPKAKYNYPDLGKINLYQDEFNDFLITSKEDILNHFLGISPKLASFILNKENPIATLRNIKNMEIKPNINNIDNKKDFYCFDLGEVEKEYASLSSLLDDFYYKKTSDDIKKNNTNNIEINIRQIVKKLNKKISKLNDDLDDARDNLIYTNYGKLIINNLYQIKADKLKEIALFDYETNKDISIKLDDTISVKQNAMKFFDKGKKALRSIPHIEEQINKTLDEVEYLELILNQIEFASIGDIEQIRDELVENHYLKKQNKALKKKKKIDILHYDLDGVLVYVGKNNVQNDYLSNTLAKKDYYWFHVKDAPSSHVVIFKSEELTEKEIRYCANLAALNSSFASSSSVPVIYTKIKYLKTIPGKRKCFLRYSNERTIYIDPKETI